MKYSSLLKAIRLLPNEISKIKTDQRSLAKSVSPSASEASASPIKGLCPTGYTPLGARGGKTSQASFAGGIIEDTPTIDSSFEIVKNYYDNTLNLDKSTYTSSNDEPTPISCILKMIEEIPEEL